MTATKVLVKKLYDDDEERVTVEANGIEVTCFTVYCPYEIKEGEEYPAEFDFEVFNGYQVTESADKDSGLIYAGKAYSYLLKGKLKGSKLNAGIVFDDDILMSDYGFLDGKYVQVNADRLDISFV